MHLSVIIPCLNEAANISSAIDRAWEAGADEVIVVDGGSRDSTMDLAHVTATRVLRSPRGRGPQQNLGARHAKGDILCFLHADTWLPPRTLTRVKRRFANDSLTGGCFRQSICGSGLLYRLVEGGNHFRARALQLPYGDQGLTIRRDVFQSLGEFPPTRLLEDLLFLQQYRRRYRMTMFDGPLFVSPRRWQQFGVLRQTLRNWGITVAAQLGVSPDYLAKFYSHAR